MAENPEEEAKRIQDEMRIAAASGDISTVVRLIASTSSMTTQDFIKQTCGGLLFLYYTYVDKLHVKPTDLIDMVDGLLYMDAKNYIIKQAQAKAEKK